MKYLQEINSNKLPFVCGLIIQFMSCSLLCKEICKEISIKYVTYSVMGSFRKKKLGNTEE